MAKNQLQRIQSEDKQKLEEIMKRDPELVSGFLFEQFSYYSGPTPPAHELEKLEKLYPGATSLLLKQANEQTMHRIYIENKVIDSNIKNSRLGLYFGLTIGIIGLAGGIVCILFGHDWAGVAISGVSLTSLVSVFVYGKSKRDEELREKEELMKSLKHTSQNQK